MPTSREFAEYVTGDLLASMRGVTARAMFGGYGVYKDGVIFGIIVDSELYLKVDESNKVEYEKLGSAPFVYEAKGGKKVMMSYWKVPAEMLEDPEELARLAEQSYLINKNREKKKVLQ